MNPIHPKVATSTIVGLVLAVIEAALQQYEPSYAPNPATAAAVQTLIVALVGWATPGPP